MTSSLTPATQALRLLKGHVVTFSPIADISWSQQQTRLHAYEQGALVIGADGKIIWHGAQSDCPTEYLQLPCDDYGNQLILPGFIDLHLHFPQYRMLAAPGKNLLDWLARFTFPEELKYGDPDFAAQAARHFLSLLYAHGTTSAMAYSSVHPESATALFEAAHNHNMALITGKTLMDRLAPSALCDTAELAYDQTNRLITQFHNKDRLRYAVTPRFAITSTEAQLEVTKALYHTHSDIYLQSHLSESQGEIEEVKRLFPASKHYTDVYATYDLLGPRAFYGHGIHLNDSECAILSESQTNIVHCPTSNLFLGSGLFNLGKISHPDRPVPIGLATDIGAGTSYSMLQTLGAAYNIAQLQGHTLDIRDLYYRATVGNAKLLGLDTETGNIQNGLYADLVVIQKASNLLQQQRLDLSESLEDILFYLIHLSDQHNISATYIAGNMVYHRKMML